MHIKTSAGWKKLPQGFIKTSAGWKKLTQGFIKTATGWKKLIFGANVTPLTVPTLTMGGSSTDFYGDGTLTLTRGDWDGAPILYYLKIQRSTNTTSGWTDVATVTLNDTSLPTSNTTYAVTDLDAKTTYYFRGYVKADNGTSFYEYTTTPVLSRISFTNTYNSTSAITANGATFYWTVAGVADSTYIYSQQLDVIRASDNVIVYTTNPLPGAGAATVSNTNIVSGVVHYPKVTVIANDGWKTSGTPTFKISTGANFTPTPVPSIVTSPTVSPLNNRSYVPSGMTSTSTQGSWTGVDVSTTYSYQWLYYTGGVSGFEGYVAIAGATSSSYAVPSTFTTTYSSTIRVRVRATNSNGQYTDAYSPIYTVDAQPYISTLSMTPSTVATGTNTSLSGYVYNYPTSYIINWGDGNTTNSGAITSGTVNVSLNNSHSYTTTGTKTITVTAQPGNMQATTTVSVVTAPTLSGGTVINSTSAPSVSGVGIGNSATQNVGTASWTNSNANSAWIYSVSGSGSGGTTVDQGLLTSGTFSIISTGSATVTIRSINKNRQATSSWTQSNALSYTASYTISGSSYAALNGTYTTSANTTSTTQTISIPVTLSTYGGTVTLNSVTLYSGSNQTGASSVFSIGVSNTPTDYVLDSVYVGSVTYTTPTVAPYNGTASVSPTSGTAGSTTFTASTSGWIANPAVSSYTYSWQYLNAFGWNTYQNSTTFVAPVNYGAYAWQLMVTASNGIAPDGKAYASFSVSEPVVSCTCVYSDAGTYYYAPQCCAGGSARTGFPTVYNSGNSVCTTCYSGNTVNSCCPNVAKIYTKCSANDVTNSSSPVYLYCYSTGQCINSTQGAGGSC